MEEFNIPQNQKEVITKLETDVKSELPTSKPNLKASYLRALIVGFAGRIYDVYVNLRVLIAQIFPDTATGTYLERWASVWNITKRAATQSRKYLIGIGTLGTTIPKDTLFTYNGFTYISEAEISVSSETKTPATVVRSGDVITVTLSSAHNLASNVLVTVAGYTPADFNVVDTEITVTSTTEFTYTLSGTSGSATGGTITYEDAIVQVLSQQSGSDTNIPNDTDASISTPIVGLNSTLKSTYDDVLSATDEETDTSLRSRLLSRIRNVFGNFSSRAIAERAREIAGTTRVKVYEITPDVGQVTMYFTRDGDTSPIPSAFEVTAMDEYLNTDEDTRIRPANMDENDFFINSAIANTINIQISSLSPNTTTMQTALNEAISDYFLNNTEIGTNFDRASFIGYLSQTIDSTGSTPTFTLDTPAANVTISQGEVPIKGTITYV